MPTSTAPKTSTKYVIPEQVRDLMFKPGSDGWKGWDKLHVQHQPIDGNSAEGRRQLKAMKTPLRSHADALDLINNTDTVR